MPVLLNKGADPRKAAWLFFSDRATVDGLGAIAARERYDAGVLHVDQADLDAAGGPAAEVPVYLEVSTLVPESFDLSTLADALAESAQRAAIECPEDPRPTLPYEPVPAPEGTRLLIGHTTAGAARSYIQLTEINGEPWTPELPGLQMLVELIDHMRGHGGIPPFSIWHIDAVGVLRMAPAKTIKPMAGNVLKCKL